MAIKFLSTVQVDTDVLYVDTSSNRVGIGTTSPSQTLHVAGNARVTGAYYDSTNSPGTGGQVLTSTATGTDWIDPTLLPAESSEKVIQTVRFGEAVSQGDPLVITGYHGSNGPAIVERADATNATKMPAYGVAIEDYAINATGFMIAVGDFDGFDTSGYSVGDTLYVAVGGGMTNIKPTGTGLIQNIGIVSRSNANNGAVEIVAIGRTNDVPNLPTGRLFVGTSGNTSLTSDVVYIDDSNDRVGIGTITPTTGKLVVSSSANQLALDTGTAGDGRLNIGHFSNGTFIGTYGDDGGGADLIRFGTHSGDERMRITSGGNVGIGTTNPSAKLDVNGTGTFRGNVDIYKSNAKLTINSTGASEQVSVDIKNTSLYARWILDADDLFRVFNQTSSFDAFAIKSSGNVGIGTTSPSNKLVVKSGTGVDLEFGSEATSAFIQTYNRTSSAYGDLRFVTNGETMRLTNTGNVGIGTTAPSQKLHINGGAMFITDGVYGGFLGKGNGLITTASASDLGIRSESNMVFSTGGYVEKMRITTAGNVGIGTTSPDSKLHIESTGEAIRFTRSGQETYRIIHGTSGLYFSRPNQGSLMFGVTQNSDFDIFDGAGDVMFRADGSTSNVGIGATTPLVKLHVETTDSSTARFAYNGSNYQDLNWEGSNIVGGSHVFKIGGAEKMRITSGGNVGIGTITPDSKLDVTGGDITVNTSGVGFMNFKYGSVGSESIMGSIQTTGIDLKINATSDLLLLPGSNVGIGTTTPTVRLDVRLSTTTGKVAELHNNAGYGVGFTVEGDGGVNTINSESNQALAFATNGASNERMRITSSGNVGIGTTSPQSKLTVNGSFSADTGSFSNELTLSSDLRLQNNITILNKAQSAYISFATRNTTGSEVVMDLTNVGSINGGAAGPYLPISAGSSYPLTGALYLEDSNTDVVMSGNTSGNFTIDNNTGNIAFNANGSSVQSMNITSSLITINEPTNFTNGNVGIGTTGPDTRLEVRGGSGTGEHAHATFTGTANRGLKISTTSVPFGQNSGTVLYDAQDGEGYGEHHWQIAGTTKMVLNKDGDVQLQTVGAKLRFQNSAGPAPYIKNSGENSSTAPYGQNLEFYTGGSKRLTIDTSGNATFAGTINSDNITVGKGDGNNSFISLTANTGNWTFTNVQASRNLEISDSDGTGVALTIDTNANATFAGGITVVGNDAQFNHNIILEGGIFHKDDTNTSFGFPADDNIAFTTSGSERMRIDSSGNVGIGTTSPASLLHIQGSTFNRVETYFSGAYISGFKFSDLNGGIWYDAGADDLYLNANHANSQVILQSGGSTTMTLDASNNVGIGTTSPDYDLDVNGNIRARENIRVFGNSLSSIPYNLPSETSVNIGTYLNDYAWMDIASSNDGGGWLDFSKADGGDYSGRIRYVNSTDQFQISTNGTQKMVITSDGNVSLNGGLLGLGKASATPSIGYGMFHYSGVGLGIYSSAGGGTQGIGFWLNNGTAAYEAGRWLSNGNLGIGTTSPQAPLSFDNIVGSKIDFYHNTTSGDRYGIEIQDSELRIHSGAQGASTGGITFGKKTTSTFTEAMRITNNSDVGIGTTSPDGKLEIVQNSGDGTPALMVVNDSSGGSGYTFQSWRYVENNTSFRLDLKQRVSAGIVKYAFDMFNNGVGYNSTLVLDRGNVGIGTDSPGQKLHVHSSSGDGKIRVSGDNILNSGGEIKGFNNGFAFNVAPSGGGTYVERMRINGSGNVGIGTASPTSKLQLKGDATYIEVRAGDNSQAVQLGTDSSGDGLLQLYSDAGLVKIKLYGEAASPSYINAGNLGIGTTTPYSKLQVVGGIQMADDTDTASANKVGTMRYRTATNEPVPVTGTELVTGNNSNFAGVANGTDVTTLSMWGAYGTVTSRNVENEKLKLITTAANTGAYIAIPTTVGNKYQLTFIASGDLGVNGIHVNSIGNASTINSQPFVFTAIAATTIIYFRAGSNEAGTTFYDNIQLIEVTEEDASYADMCMQTGASTYEWVNIVRNTY